MESVLIMCSSGVMYSGELLEAFSEKRSWIGIKPSKYSDILMYFSMNRIKKIYFQCGEAYINIDTDLCSKPELDLDIPEQDVVLLRVKGGITYRGQRLVSLPNDISWKDGRWITPTATLETIIYVPEYEVEKVYSM